MGQPAQADRTSFGALRPKERNPLSLAAHDEGGSGTGGGVAAELGGAAHVVHPADYGALFSGGGEADAGGEGVALADRMGEAESQRRVGVPLAAQRTFHDLGYQV